MCRISKIITFLESLRQAGWFDLFESDIQSLLIFDPLITLWGNFDAPYLKLLNDASVASACFYVTTCRRVRNSKKIATIRDFHLPGSFLCLSTRLKYDMVTKKKIMIGSNMLQLDMRTFQEKKKEGLRWYTTLFWDIACMYRYQGISNFRAIDRWFFVLYISCIN